jgi:Flp pilus assembly protein TadD
VRDRYPTPNAFQIVGTELAAAGRHAEAIAALRQAAGGYPPARYFLGTELIAAGQVDEGIDELRLFVAAEPQLLAARAAHGALANALAGRRRFAEAIPHYREYLAAHPADADAWTGLGIAFAQSGDRAGALRAFREAATAAPSNVRFQLNFARALLDAGEVDHAGRLAHDLSRAAPRDPAAHDILGRVLAAKGDRAGARAAFVRALQLDPGFLPAREALQAIADR